MSKEGWGWIRPKWHYFVNGMSLCGLTHVGFDVLEQGNDFCIGNCAECQEKLKKRRAEE